jgi:cell division septal protein FtsQ
MAAKPKRKIVNRRKKDRNVLDVKLRNDQLRKQRTKIASGFFSVLFVVAAIVLVAWRGVDWSLSEFVYRNPAFAIRDIEVTTDGYLTRETILQWAGVKPKDNLMALDLQLVKRQLERVPVVGAVSLERMLPDRLRIKVEERHPVARVSMLLPHPNGKEHYTATVPLDPQGYVLVPLRRNHVTDHRVLNYAALPELKGFDESELRTSGKLANPNVLAALRLVAEFRRSPMLGLIDIEQIELERNGILTALTRKGMQVKFSSENRFDQQLSHWRQIHDLARQAGKKISKLDLSVTNNVPLHWQNAAPANRRSSARPTRRIHPSNNV